MVTKQRTIIRTSGFFKWFFCGCEVTHVETIKIKRKKAKIKTVEKKVVVKDDLTVIEGIGPVIQKLLYKNKIYSFKDLSYTKVKKLKEILEEGSLSQHSPITWPRQSKMAYQGKWKELEKWQDELSGGRKK